MKVNCEGCAGCCIDWRPLANRSLELDHERRGPHRPLDDVYNLVPLSRDEVRGFVDAGLGDALVPRLWHAPADEGVDGVESVEVGGVRVAALDGRPAFFVGLRKPTRPVAPFGADATWLRACVFLDPETLQCRVHGGDRYPRECAEYPGHNLVLDRETECERVEAEWGDEGDRLADATPPEGLRGLLLGPHAVGAKLFAHPDPDAVGDAVARLAAGEATDADRAAFVAVAVASSPGSLSVQEAKRAEAAARLRATDSWTTRSLAAAAAAPAPGTPADEGDPAAVAARDVARGAPETPGWDAVRDDG